MKCFSGSCEVAADIATLELEALCSEMLLLSAAKYSLFYKLLSSNKEFSKQSNI